MKKIIVAAVAALACISIDAQLWVGGSLGFTTDKDEANADNVRETDIEFEPVVGYAINDQLEVGAGLELNTTKNFLNEKDHKYNSFGICPFVRYKFLESGKLSFHLQGNIGYYRSHYDLPEEDRTYETFEIGVSPLVKYSVTEHISLVSSFGWLGFYKAKDQYSELELNLDSALSFGIYYSF